MHKTAAAPATASSTTADDQLLAGLDEEFTGPKEGEDVDKMSDPLRHWNAVWFHFNDKLYFWVLRPVSKGYGKVVPEPARKGIDNVFNNLRTPVPLVSFSLQGRWADARRVLCRFGLNSTVGVLGWRDVAAIKHDLPGPNEDIDQAFGAWGIGTGPYLVWPFFGPSSVRGTFGSLGDRLLNPTSWLPRYWNVAVAVTDKVNETSLDPDHYQEMRMMTVVPYTAVRNAYYQNRKELVEE